MLLQVNVSGEESKGGFSQGELKELWPRIHEQPNLTIAELMTMAPRTPDEAIVRKTFRGLRELRDQLIQLTPKHPLPELSMGMSGDFEIAIEEGATLIRLGSILFDGSPSE